MTQPEQTIAVVGDGSQMVAGPPPYITLSNIIMGNDATNMYVRCDTDQSCQLRYRMWREKDPATIYTETESSAAVGKRYQTLPRSGLGAMDVAGEVVFIELSVPVPPNPATPYMRTYTGTTRVTGRRTTTNGTAVPVRFNGFTGPFSAAVPTLGTKGNWSTYTWSQWNPKGIA